MARLEYRGNDPTFVGYREEYLRRMGADAIQAARVVRPGGGVTIFDGDYASWTFGCSDAELGRAMEQAILAAVVSYVYVDIGGGSFFLSAAETYAPVVQRWPPARTPGPGVQSRAAARATPTSISSSEHCPGWNYPLRDRGSWVLPPTRGLLAESHHSLVQRIAEQQTRFCALHTARDRTEKP